MAKPKIIIVAGGLATRLRPITEAIPKCLVDLNGKPLIQHQLEFFRDKGYEDIIFCVAHLAYKVKEYLKEGEDLGLKIHYIQETEDLRGTAGSVKLAEEIIGPGEDFIVYYGDSITNMDLDEFIRFHKEKNAIATICMRPLPEGYKSSSIAILDGNNKVTAFIEKPNMEEQKIYNNEKLYINNGIYAFKREIFDLIPQGIKYDFAKQLFPRLIAMDCGIYGYPTQEFFKEIGTVEKYNKFLEEFKDKEILAKNQNKAVFIDRDGVINTNVKDLTTPEQFELLPGVAEAIKKFNHAGYKVIIVTNQPIIAKGFCTFDDMDKIHRKMIGLLFENDAHIDSIYVCPHHPERGFEGEVAELKINCKCRKPEPGLILTAAKEHNIDLRKSYMIGDSEKDVLAGKRAGVSTILVRSGSRSLNKQESMIESAKPDMTASNLIGAAKLIL